MFFQRADLDALDWNELDRFPDRTIYQTRPWLNFLAETQRAQPVVAVLRDGQKTLGYFTGAIVKWFGLPILGSPFPGWTTCYMGFNLCPGVSRGDALGALADFAFRDLACVHLEMMDRRLTEPEARQHGFSFTPWGAIEMDLRPGEDQLYNALSGNRRRGLRKAEENGVVIEEAADLDLAREYHDQLLDVFAKQRLVPTFSRARVAALLRHLLPSGNLLLLRARGPDGRCIATGIFTALNDTAALWGAASRPGTLSLHPNEAIEWYAIRYWKRRGCLTYDLGGTGRRPQSGRHKDEYGGSRFSALWVRKSKYPFLERARNLAKRFFKLSQRARGLFRR
jgi:hypothetical protein